MNTDVDAVVYLMLVNNVLHDLFPSCITIGGWGGRAGRVGCKPRLAAPCSMWRQQQCICQPSPRP
jgi:hypothetical protein